MAHLNISSEDAATLLTDINRLAVDMLVQEFGTKPIELKIAEIAVQAVEKILDTYIMAAIAKNNAG